MRYFTIVVTLTGLLTIHSQANAQNIKAALVMDELFCAKTTEMSEDEVYLILAGKKSDNTLIRTRVPGNNGHWDLNDNGDKKRRVKNITLWEGELKNGESIDLFVIGMEEDWKPNDAIDKAITDVMSMNIFNAKYATGARAFNDDKEKDESFWKELAKKLFEEGLKKAFDGVFKNQDDYLGSVAVRLWNDGGNLRTDYRPIAKCTASNDPAWLKAYPQSKIFRLYEKDHREDYTMAIRGVKK